MWTEFDIKKLPRHLAIIMDGNGRWAQARGMRRLEGHRKGAETVRLVTRTCRKIGIRYLTLYAFSHENWERPKLEIEGLMRLLNRFLAGELKEMLDNGIRLNAIGDLNRLPGASVRLLRETIAKTEGNSDMVLTLALSYGGRQDVLNACRQIAELVRAGEIKAEDVDESVLGRHLYTNGLPDPDLLIRTGGEHRVSNFMLWQIAYTELYITETFWPDFDERELKSALLDYAGRQRRFGRTGEQVDSAERKAN